MEVTYRGSVITPFNRECFIYFIVMPSTSTICIYCPITTKAKYFHICFISNKVKLSRESSSSCIRCWITKNTRTISTFHLKCNRRNTIYTLTSFNHIDLFCTSKCRKMFNNRSKFFTLRRS